MRCRSARSDFIWLVLPHLKGRESTWIKTAQTNADTAAKFFGKRETASGIDEETRGLSSVDLVKGDICPCRYKRRPIPVSMLVEEVRPSIPEVYAFLRSSVYWLRQFGKGSIHTQMHDHVIHMLFYRRRAALGCGRSDSVRLSGYLGHNLRKS